MHKISWLLLVGMCACSGAPKARVPFRTEFDEPLGAEWRIKGGHWYVTDGHLYNDGAHNVPLWLDAALPTDVRISFDAESKSDAVDLKFEVFGDGVHHQSGYVVILGGWNNSKSIIARLDEHGPERTPAQEASLRAEVERDAKAALELYRDRREVAAKPDTQQRDHKYHFRFERRGHDLSFFADGTLVMSYFDPSPLSGPGHDRFAFNNWASQVFFDNLMIEPL